MKTECIDPRVASNRAWAKMEVFLALSQVSRKRGQKNENKKNKKSLRKRERNLKQRGSTMPHKLSWCSCLIRKQPRSVVFLAMATTNTWTWKIHFRTSLWLRRSMSIYFWLTTKAQGRFLVVRSILKPIPTIPLTIWTPPTEICVVA